MLSIYSSSLASDLIGVEKDAYHNQSLAQFC
jgi:hypothetical protein